jgi:hypothetical protein
MLPQTDAGPLALAEHSSELADGHAAGHAITHNAIGIVPVQTLDSRIINYCTHNFLILRLILK